jgi:hypothetical protein
VRPRQRVARLVDADAGMVAAQPSNEFRALMQVPCRDAWRAAQKLLGTVDGADGVRGISPLVARPLQAERRAHRACKDRTACFERPDRRTCPSRNSESLLGSRETRNAPRATRLVPSASHSSRAAHTGAHNATSHPPVHRHLPSRRLLSGRRLDVRCVDHQPYPQSSRPQGLNRHLPADSALLGTTLPRCGCSAFSSRSVAVLSAVLP